MHINDLRKITDIDSIWFSACEYDAIESDIRETVSAIESGSLLDKESQCSRGLEGLTCDGRRARRAHIMSGLCSVLDEQDLQRDEGINDPELLADVFFDVTYDSQSIALEIARQDQENVQKV